MLGRRSVAAFAWIALTVVSTRAEGRQSPAPPPTTGEAFRLPDDRLGRRIAPILLLSREDVRADLKLDARQSADAKQAMGELYERAAALKGKSGSEVIERRREIDEACEGWINQYLTETQRTRLAQIGLQWEGAGALANQPTLAEQVGLSSEQKRQIAEAVALRDSRREAGTPALEAERELASSTLGLLRPAQRERWKAMLGDPFTPILRDPGVLPASSPTP